MTKDRYVYVLSSSFGYQKIGWSTDPFRRQRTLSGASPVPLTLTYAIPHANACHVERQVHLALCADRLNGEWFRVSLEQAVAEINRIAEKSRGSSQNKKYTVRKRIRCDSRVKYKWTSDRIDMLKVLRPRGVPARDIRKELMKLPGSFLSPSSIGVKAYAEKLKRYG